MGQIKDAINLSQCINGYSIKDIIGANRNISKKMKELELKIYNETQLRIQDGLIFMNPEEEVQLVEGYGLIIPDTTRIVTHYDIYRLDENGSIIVVGKKTLNDKKEISKADRDKIEKYKSVLMEYYKLYNATKQINIYSIYGTDLMIFVQGERSVLYRESEQQKKFPSGKVNPYETNFYISINGDEIRIDHYFREFASDCEEIYDMDMNFVLSNIKIEDELPAIIIDNIIPVSIVKTKNPKNMPGLRKGSSFKVIDYSLVKDKQTQFISQLKTNLDKVKIKRMSRI